MAFVNCSPGLARQRNPGITVRVYGIATLKGFANYRLANAVCVALFPNRFPRVSVALLPSNPGLSLANTETFDLRYDALSQLTIHGIPNRSTHMLNLAAQKVSWNGICTLPFSAKALKMRSPSAISFRWSDTFMPFGCW